MTAVMQLAARPTPADDGTTPSRYRAVGLTLALIGLMGATISVTANFVAAGDRRRRPRNQLRVTSTPRGALRP